MEEQQNNNLSMEILNGNAESVTGLVGNAQALKEPGTNDCQVYSWSPLATLFTRTRGGAARHLSYVFFSRHRWSPERLKIYPDASNQF